jgi:hypothetical protein
MGLHQAKKLLHSQREESLDWRDFPQSGTSYGNNPDALQMMNGMMIAILAGVTWNLTVFLICTYFMAREVEHFFMYLLAICTSSFEKSLSIHVPISSLGCWFLGSWVFWVPYRFWILVSPLLDEYLAKREARQPVSRWGQAAALPASACCRWSLRGSEVLLKQRPLGPLLWMGDVVRKAAWKSNRKIFEHPESNLSLSQVTEIKN